MSAPDPTLWLTLRRIIDLVDEAPAEDRDDVLLRECKRSDGTLDEALLAEARALLAIDMEADGFLSEAAADRAVHLLTEGGPDVAGERVGPWEVIELLGEGGMGAVYRARRADGAYDQNVALKMIGRGLAPPTLLDRFRLERQILAGLRHPNVSRLLDGGLSDAGQPYFAMELVEGEPITDYVERRQLDTEARVRLFRQVTDAVAYAHRRLVVHRDLKPSNVLVAEDAKGRPRATLLDFGIAKLLDDDGELQTRTGGALTPEYAAPEQISGGEITTATDVYALGVLLYELLSGRRPHETAGLSPTATEQALQTLPPPPTAASGQRVSDLDAVVLKALAPEADRRYPSADAFGDDLDSFLGGLPVQAKAPTAVYRIQTFVRRHPAGVAMAAALALLLVGFSVVTATQARRLADERDRAETEARKSEEVATFLGNLFDVSNPLSPQAVRGDTLTARTILARGADRIETDLADDPAVQVEMMERIGLVYTNLGLYDEAEALLDTALTRSQGAFGDESPEASQILLSLGQHWHERGEYEQSAALYRQSLDIRQLALGGDHESTAETQHYLGVTLKDLGELDESEALLRDALVTRRAVLGDTSLQVAYTLNSLGNVLRLQERLGEANEAFAEVLAIRRDRLGSDHPSTAVTISNLALALRDEERFDEAEPLLRESLGHFRRELGEEHLYVAIGLNNLADTLMKQDKDGEAEPLLRDAIAMMQSLHPDGHPATALMEDKLGGALVALTRYNEAEPILQRSHAAILETFGPEHAYTTTSRERLAALDNRPTP
ncbi:MAG: serine/threonine-protein kinase [Bacteroidota bacterium]